MSRSMIMMSFQVIIVKPFIHEESIKSNCFAHFTFTFLMKEIFFDDVVACCSNCGSKISAKIGCLTVLTSCVD